MMFEDFAKDIKDINNIAHDQDIKDIENCIGFIEQKLEKIGRKNKDKLYSLIGDAIQQIPSRYIVDLSAKENLGYKIASAVELFDGDYDCNGDIYEFLDDNKLYVITNGIGFVTLTNYLEKNPQYKHIINMLARNYELILNNPDIPDEYKEPIRKIENLFKVFGIKEN